MDASQGNQEGVSPSVNAPISPWKRAWRAAWRLRFVFVQAILLGVVVWVLWPLRQAALLPNPVLSPVAPPPPERQETLVMGAATFAPGTQGAVRVVVYDPDSGAPISDAGIRVSMSGVTVPLFEGRTNDQGTARVQFDLPLEQGEYGLIVDVIGAVGEQRVAQPVHVRSETAWQLSTDKLSYGPGDTVQIRLYAADATTLLPAVEHPVILALLDGHGHRVCAVTAATSAFGLAAARCELADEVSAGQYRVLALAGEEPVAEQAVSVSNRDLGAAHFNVQIQAQDTYALPGQHVEGTVRVRYAWGEPFSGTLVTLRAQGLPGQEKEIGAVQGKADDQGEYSFSLKLPQDLLSGAALEAAVLELEATAVDPAGRVARDVLYLPLAWQAISVRAMPESGVLKPGVENIVHLVTAYADGTPARCRLVLETPGGETVVQTDPEGRGEWRYTPAPGESFPLAVAAQDEVGRTGHADVLLAAASSAPTLLLRPERLVYTATETMHLDIWGPGMQSAVYLDLFRDGQLADTRTAMLVDGHAAVDVDLSPFSGVLTLYAYVLLPDGGLAVDARAVTVHAGHGLDVSLQVQEASYPPGEIARVQVRTSDVPGKGVQSALNVALLDRVVPFQPQDKAAAFLPIEVPAGWFYRYAGVVSKPRPLPEAVQAEIATVEAARAARSRAFARLAGQLAWVLLGAAGLSLAVVALDVWRVGEMKWRFAGGVLISGAVALPLAVAGMTLLAWLGQRLFGSGAVIFLGLGWFGALLALLVYGWKQGDGWAQLLVALLLAFLALLWGIGYALQQGGALERVEGYAALGAWAGVLWALYAFALAQFRAQARAPKPEGGAGGAAGLALLLLLALTVGGTLIDGLPAPPRAEPSPAVAAPTPTPEPVMSMPAPAPVLGEASGTDWPVLAAETLFWQPVAMTDRQGYTVVQVPLGRQAGARQLEVRALTGHGGQRTARAELDVSTSLFVEPLVPRSLTVGDQLDLPVVVYNPLPVTQTVRLTVTTAPWFRLRQRDADVHEIDIPAGQREVVDLPLQIQQWGDHVLQIAWQGRDVREAVSLPVTVSPAGATMVTAYARQTDETNTYKIRMPWSAVPGTEHIVVKLYPNWESVLTEGLQSALGRLGPVQWERTAIVSPTFVLPVAYPQALSGSSLAHHLAAARVHALFHHYLTQHDRLTRDLSTRLERAAGLDYQRLLAWADRSTPDLAQRAAILSALAALQPFYVVDSLALEEVAEQLLAAQAPDGAWYPAELPPGWADLPREDLPLSASITWALVDAGYADMPKVVRAVEHLIRYLDQAQDPYTLALVMHALAAYDDACEADLGDTWRGAADRLADMAQIEDGEAVWVGSLTTLDGAAGASADLERTALAASALLRVGRHVDLGGQGLAALANSRDGLGTWHSPQVTRWALWALAEAKTGSGSFGRAVLRVRVNEIETEQVVLAGKAGEPGYVFYFDDLVKGYNDVAIELQGGPVLYQVIGAYALPWSQVPSPGPEEEAVSLTTSYDRLSLIEGQVVTVTVGATLNRAGVAPLVILELGLPPGLEPLLEDWRARVAEGTIAGYELQEASIRVYLADLDAEQPVRFSYRLRAVFPVDVRTLPAQAFYLADPTRPTLRAPVEIEVVPER